MRTFEDPSSPWIAGGSMLSSSNRSSISNQETVGEEDCLSVIGNLQPLS